jgi:hypothetical protein
MTMNTILKSGTVTTALLLAISACGTDQHTAHDDAPAVRSAAQSAQDSYVSSLLQRARSVAARPRECRISPALVDAWAQYGQALPRCAHNHNLRTHHVADDRRPHR